MKLTSLEIAGILSTVYAILVVVGYFPGLKSIIKEKHLTGVNSSFWYLVNTTVGISFYNLFILQEHIFQICAVGINLLLGLLCLLIVNYKKQYVKGLVYTLVFILFLGAFVVWLHQYPQISQSVATVSIILAYIGQVFTFYNKKTSSGTNKWLYLLIGLGLSLLIISMILTNTYTPIVITELVNFVLIMVCYFQSNYYPKE